ncbi:acetate kinase [Streptococcus oricebi]|uniref:Acetate kinase n=1 Tax=Streptococcus oricebi TaxID=1547447 RepID=A0ABS5B448_9STRE|nr:acetate kinase [Streptococcus oricebi]MBP2623603.1 acetate kinase [Streptococcus oricebi]
MSKTIAINAGSSSLKWQLYLMPEEEVIAKGLIERIGLNDAISTVKFDGKEEKQVLAIADHTQAVKILLDDLMRLGIIKSYDEITGVGHRVVAGGEHFKDSALVDEDVIQKVEELTLLAPLHNGANAAGIRAFKEILPDITSVVVFDTSFHTSMPEKAYRYPLPSKYYRENQVRKYGAHGTSHEYVAQEAAKIMGKPLEDLKLVTAHIGNGVSITAIDSGKSVDTSMGFTPLAGVMMGTRTGDIDPAIIPYLLEHSDDFQTAEDISRILNRESGLLGVSEVSNDMRDVMAAMEQGDAKSQLAYDMFIDRIVKYIGQYLAVLSGADGIIFTAGIGENDPKVRQDIIRHFEWAGAKLDASKNEVRPVKGLISTEDASLKVLVIPTDEELVIARDVERLKK